MRTHHRVAAVAASLALAGGGLLGMASQAAASPSALSCDSPTYLTGSGGHRGASIRCTGSSFTGVIDCYKPGYGTYRHFGNRAASGGTSTTWCDLNATVSFAGATPS
ncbi:hypothetical protein ACPXCE_22825 [Streptomyces sp. DT24]|uniref:hypothetical protein n=1 Tax=unclassified Streptomyces TaxID=2593676 RepID=UPI0023B91663|nr:hypothetical protein [Streptomyces sp. AM 4-1-1]WEH36328.1 hypothetical protein PZB75_25035 [Streptomyces sp. AM 4-1-1]